MYRILSTVLLLTYFVVTIEAIVGGQDAQIGQFPYAVSILDPTSANNVVCGGVVIDVWSILTHSSCIQENHMDKYKVFIGELQLANQSVENLYSIGKTKINGSLVILKVKRELNNDTVTPAQLPAGVVPINVDMELMGWGVMDTNKQSDANILQYLSLRTITTVECEYTWDQIGDDQFCTTHSAYSCGPCLNDIGAPLIYNDQVFGILSNASSECIGENPNIYININNYLQWIESSINE